MTARQPSVPNLISAIRSISGCNVRAAVAERPNDGNRGFQGIDIAQHPFRYGATVEMPVLSGHPSLSSIHDIVLTLTLSPARGNRLWPHGKKSLALSVSPAHGR